MEPIYKLKRLVLVDIGNKLLARIIEGFEEKRLLAVPTVNTDPCVSYAI